MSHINIYVHAVWTTKCRIRYFNTFELRDKVWRHIFDYGRENEIHIDHINGYVDHCHCLISLKVEQSISKALHLLKGESAHWINKENFCNQKFGWQNKYYATSVSVSHLERVRKYIQNQEQHHRAKTFENELKSTEEFTVTKL